jgi:hypothetical protein
MGVGRTHAGTVSVFCSQSPIVPPTKHALTPLQELLPTVPVAE